ncbi:MULTISPECIES: TetR/AcrR family transcriptional regulator [Micromonospora]|uniref:Transcriptional regulator, TetR family n=1 Tax=Micromonospora yangpuensis TaxID=683228 RepID=A0A1C6UKT8_9ACTN|nr:helix-turn-helix domain-containing protein [Micromonospora yangpuensis]GGM17411.1 TetR family transcriptional regulator [Micromonospora yangpuensis]SCL54685.1 transcriptional regulator, TetR family [Micromonospora yangpuensis]
MRADAQRNRALLVKAASAAIARDGAYASLEEIARAAGVGSATLHRHFPSRWALLEAVFHDRIEALCARAGELAAEPDAREALTTWLCELAVYSATTRGLVTSLLKAPQHSNSCSAMLVAAGEPLRRRAADEGSVSPDVAMADLVTLVNAVALAVESASATEAERLVRLALRGISPPRR